MTAPEDAQDSTTRCDSQHRGHTCMRDAPHPGQWHQWEEPDGTVGSRVLIWTDFGDDVQPEYPLGSIDMSEPWVVRAEEFRG